MSWLPKKPTRKQLRLLEAIVTLDVTNFLLWAGMGLLVLFFVLLYAFTR